MQHDMVITAMRGGLLGTLGQMLRGYGVAPLMAGPPWKSRPCATSPVLRVC